MQVDVKVETWPAALSSWNIENYTSSFTTSCRGPTGLSSKATVLWTIFHNNPLYSAFRTSCNLKFPSRSSKLTIIFVRPDHTSLEAKVLLVI
jgi:hypothetical protein